MSAEAKKEKPTVAKKLVTPKSTIAKTKVAKPVAPKPSAPKPSPAKVAKPKVEVKKPAAAEKKLKEAQPQQDEAALEDLSTFSYDDQVALFNAIRGIFSLANNHEQMRHYASQDDFFMIKFEEVINLAVEGNVPAQDYLTYLYKRGKDGFFGIDLIRAHQWGLVAVSGGSKLSTERLRLFFSPVYNYVEKSGRAEEVIEKNDLDDETILPFIAGVMANLVLDELGINLLSLSRQGVISEPDDNVEEFMRKLESTRNNNFEKMMSYLTLERKFGV